MALEGGRFRPLLLGFFLAHPVFAYLCVQDSQVFGISEEQIRDELFSVEIFTHSKPPTTRGKSQLFQFSKTPQSVGSSGGETWRSSYRNIHSLRASLAAI
jgi:hypothetical protein